MLVLTLNVFGHFDISIISVGLLHVTYKRVSCVTTQNMVSLLVQGYAVGCSMSTAHLHLFWLFSQRPKRVKMTTAMGNSSFVIPHLLE